MQTNLNRASKVFESGINLSLILISITFPLPSILSNVGVGLLVASWLFKKIAEKDYQLHFHFKEQKWMVIVFSVFFLFQLFSLLYTHNVGHGLKNVESKLSLLLLPLVLFDLKIDFSKIIRLLRYYVYSLAICSLLLIANSMLNYLSKGSLLVYHDFVSPLGFHAIFFSYYCFLAVLVSAFFFQKALVKGKERGLLILALTVLFCGLIIAASKNVLVVTVLFIVLGFAQQLLKNRLSVKALVVSVLAAIVLLLGASQIGVVNDRVSELTDLSGMENYHRIKQGDSLMYYDIDHFNGTSLRITFWDLAINQVFDEQKVLLGLSPGDRREIMNTVFQKYGLIPYYSNYNIHNQFIQVFVELGIFAFLLYLLLHWQFMKSAIKRRNYLLLFFLIGLIIFQLTESLIERNHGIVFFCFFLPLLQSLNFTDENRDIRH